MIPKMTLTVDILKSVLITIEDAFQEKKESLALSVDFKQTFDTV